MIYVKNRVNRSWYNNEGYSPDPPTAIIPEEEKARVRDRLLPILATSETLVRQQLIPVLQRILQYDFPAR